MDGAVQRSEYVHFFGRILEVLVPSISKGQLDDILMVLSFFFSFLSFFPGSAEEKERKKNNKRTARVGKGRPSRR